MDDEQQPISAASEEISPATQTASLLPEPKLAGGEVGHATPGVHFSSKKLWFKIGLAVAILNPMLSGLILGVFFWKEPEMKREGKIITSISVVWGAIALLLAKALRSAGY